MDTERIMEIQRDTPYPSSKSVKEALLKVWRETLEQNKWKPISQAPKDGTWIMLLMDSGYTTTPYGFIIAHFVDDYSQSRNEDHRWRDHANDSVFDGFSKIIGWCPWSVPDITFDPDEGIYTILKRGDAVNVGDEIEVEGSWVAIEQNDLDSCLKLTGSKFICKEGKIRRRA
jgi:hypothetical protein